jgi:hypothetical protein
MRDKKGRYIGTDTGEGGNNNNNRHPHYDGQVDNFLNNPPSIKAIILLFLLLWVLSLFSPRIKTGLDEKITDIYCQVDGRNSSSLSSGTTNVDPKTPPRKES